MTDSRLRDFGTSLLFVLVGAAFAYGAKDFRFGTSAQPGAGYFPFGLGSILVLIGIALGIRTATSPKGPAEERSLRLRPLIVTLVSVLLFALLAKRAGLLLTVFIVMMVSSFADESPKIGRTALLSVAMAIFTWLVFKVGIGMPMPVLPTFVRF